MRPNIFHLAFTASVLLSVSTANAHDFGVSSSSAGRGTEYTDNRGGSAYVGPNGFAAQGADGRTVAGSTGLGADRLSGYGSAAIFNQDAATINATQNVAAAVSTLPYGYIATIPAGCPTQMYGAYNCSYYNGAWYRPIFYGGNTVYVVVP